MESDDVQPQNNIIIPKISRAARYYRLHREDRLEKAKEAYHSRPDVIAKKQEKEKKKVEKLTEAQKEEKRKERERLRQEKLEIAIKTSKKNKQPSECGLDIFLDPLTPAWVDFLIF